MSDSPIKLFLVNTMEDGTQRLQSQLQLGRLACDFLLKDDVLKVWGNRGEFIEYDKPYVVVTDVSEMKRQPL